MTLCSQAFSQGASIWVQDKCHCLAVLSFNTIKSWQTAYCSLHRKHLLWPWWILTSYKQSQATLLMKHISWTGIAWPQPSTEIFPSTQRVNAKILCFSSPWMCSNDKTRHEREEFFGSDLSLILFNCSTDLSMLVMNSYVATRQPFCSPLWEVIKAISCGTTLCMLFSVAD